LFIYKLFSNLTIRLINTPKSLTMRNLIILTMLSALTIAGCNNDMAHIARTMEQIENIDKTFTVSINDEDFKGLRCYASIPAEGPIYLIDGLSVSEDKLKEIQPNEIKSITILKSVKATALYGSRAKDGVVIINKK